MGIVAGEARMPRYDMPRATKNPFVRIILIFLTSCILISVLVPYTEPLLLGTSNVTASPFVIAMGYAGIPVLPHIINVVLLICLCGIGSESLFIASRIQTAMAKMGMMPRIFGKIDDKGRPFWSLAACSLITIAMTYMCVSTTGAIAFNWFSSISATTTFFAWMVGQDFENSQTQRANSFDCRLSRSRTGACTVPSKCKVIVHLRCPMHSRIVFGLWSPSFSSSPPYSHSSVPSTYPSCQMKVLHLQAISSRQCSASPCLSSLISGTSCGLEQASRTP